MKSVIIVGSSRKNGDTGELTKKLVELSGYDTINLLDYNIAHFDYDYKNTDDDFLPLMEKLINNYEHFIFVTPVYWYSMSGVLKVNNLGDTFWIVFQETATYLGMSFNKGLHTIPNSLELQALRNFLKE